MNVPVYTEPPLTHIPMTKTMKYNRNPFQFIKSFWISGFILGGSTGTTNNYASADAGVKVR